MSGRNYGYTHIKSVFGAVCRELGKKCTVKESAHPSLKQGRAAEIAGGSAGFLGELSDEVRKNFGLEQPVALLEMEL